MTIRLFGLPRTGTNIFYQVLTKNYDCDVVLGSNKHQVWKHGCYNRPDDKPVLVITRHPLSFLWASWKIAGIAYSGCKSFEDFIYYRQVSSRENPLLHRWSFAYGYWIWRREFINQCRIVQWESLLKDPESVCDYIADSFGFEKDGQFQMVTHQVGPHQTRESGYELIKRQELGKDYLEHYSDDMIEYCRDRIDKKVASWLGYKV